MIAQFKQTNQQKPDSRKTTIIHLVGISLICTLAVCLTVYLDHIFFWRNTSNTYRQKDPNTSVYSQKGWAQRLDVPGLPNFHKVSDNLYRGAQPTAEGMSQLKELGIKTVVNLRSAHSDRDELGDTKLAYEHINMTTLNFKNEDAVRFLKIVTDSNYAPVFVHCQHGADRTGTMCAVYRIAVQGWSKDEAIEEMIHGGFGFHKIWKNLVDYIRRMDIDEVKQNAGLKE